MKTMTDNRRERAGRQAYHAGAAAEDNAARAYRGRGASLLARRHRTPEGEIDLILQEADTTVFVEVKRRKRRTADSPISARQWNRVARAAMHYIASGAVPATKLFRFDAALLDASGRVEVIENAWMPGLA